MLVALALVCLVGSALGDTVVLNEAVDQLLAGLRDQLVANNKDTLSVSELNQEWQYKWKFVKLSGHCNCRDGYARSLASIRRTADVSMTTQGNRVILRAGLGLGTLEFGFRYCQVKANHLFSVTQEVDASVSSNSIVAQISLVKEGQSCTASLDDISLASLGDIRVETGSSELHKIEDKILNWFIDKFHGEIQGGINNALQEAARQRIGQVDLCSKIPF